MTRFNHRDEASLGDVLEALSAILEYAGVGRERFTRERMVRDAIVRQFEILGEATKRLSTDFRDRHKDVPWKRMAGFRDILIHHYEQVEPGEVWRTIQSTLPDLLDFIKRIRKSEGW